MTLSFSWPLILILAGLLGVLGKGWWAWLVILIAGLASVLPL